ncbi:MAG: DNA-processing protein DprA [Candidatus Sumerlaeia bacterium]
MYSVQEFWYALAYDSSLSYADINDMLHKWSHDEKRGIEELFASGEGPLRRAELNDNQIRGLSYARRELAEARRRLEAAKLAGLKMTTIDSERYPRLMRQTLGLMAPPVLFYAGDAELFNAPLVGIIGARKAKESSLGFTRECGDYLGQRGIGVVSGFAEGVDQAASLAALKAGGKTVLVLPQGLLSFSEKGISLTPLVDEGRALVVSAWRPRDGWMTSRAMMRNGMITAMARDIIVAQSGKDGGTWEASRTGLKQGKRVWVRDDGDPKLGHEELRQLGARIVDWPSRDFEQWLDSVVICARDGGHTARTDREWSAEEVLELLRTGTPDAIHEASGITGKLLIRIVEGRQETPLTSLWDLQRIKGLGPSAMVEIAEAFGLEAPESGAAQIPLFPEVEEFRSWKSEEGTS